MPPLDYGHVFLDVSLAICPELERPDAPVTCALFASPWRLIQEPVPSRFATPLHAVEVIGRGTAISSSPLLPLTCCLPQLSCIREPWRYVDLTDREGLTIRQDSRLIREPDLREEPVPLHLHLHQYRFLDRH